MKLSDFDYHLPPGLIAQHPPQQRDSCRLMVLDREDGSIQHHSFQQLIDFIYPGDTLVFNDSRVIPARLKGTIEDTGRSAEILLLKQLSDGTWEALVRPGRKLMPGARVIFFSSRVGDAKTTIATITQRLDNGLRRVHFSNEASLENFGEMPLPPYIRVKLEDRERYQTIYSSVKGSSAAPTAGLHFTPELLEKIKQNGVNLCFITLHIGLDTFQPVRVEDPLHHHIHSEYGKITQDTAELLNQTRASGKRTIAIGTTTVRLIESAAQTGIVVPFEGPVELYILPGFKFRATDAMVTNFHLPRSTLLMMVSAFAGREFALQAYERAKESGYRFYSFGDAMLIL